MFILYFLLFGSSGFRQRPVVSLVVPYLFANGSDHEMVEGLVINSG